MGILVWTRSCYPHQIDPKMRIILSVVLISALVLESAVTGPPSARIDNEYKQTLEMVTKALSPCLKISSIIGQSTAEAIEMVTANGAHKDIEECKHYARASSKCSAATMMAFLEAYGRQLSINLGATDGKTDKIDMKVLKEAIFGSSTLSDALKQSAMDTFDGCMAASPPTPYSFFFYKNDQMPATMEKYISNINQVYIIDDLAPSTMLQMDSCISTALMQNSCIPTDPAVIKEFNAAPKKPHD